MVAPMLVPHILWNDQRRIQAKKMTTYVAQDAGDDAHPSSDTDHPCMSCPPSPSTREQLNPTFPRQTLDQHERQQSKRHKRDGKPLQHRGRGGESRSDVAWSEVFPKSSHPWWWNALGDTRLGCYCCLFHLNRFWLGRLRGFVPIIHNVPDKHDYSRWHSNLPNGDFEYAGADQNSKRRR